MRNTTHKGDIGEKKFELWCLEHNIECCRPLSNGKPYDYIILYHDKWQTVQVKCASYTTTSDYKYPVERVTLYKAGTRYNKGNNSHYKTGDFDLLFICGDHYKFFWLIPFSDLQGTLSIQLVYRGELDLRYTRYIVS